MHSKGDEQMMKDKSYRIFIVIMTIDLFSFGMYLQIKEVKKMRIKHAEQKSDNYKTNTDPEKCK
jgi:hypothetical protein